MRNRRGSSRDAIANQRASLANRGENEPASSEKPPPGETTEDKKELEPVPPPPFRTKPPVVDSSKDVDVRPVTPSHGSDIPVSPSQTRSPDALMASQGRNISPLDLDARDPAIVIAERKQEMRCRFLPARMLPFQALFRGEAQHLASFSKDIIPVNLDCLGSLNGMLAFAFFVTNYRLSRRLTSLLSENNPSLSMQRFISKIAGYNPSWNGIEIIKMLANLFMQTVLCQPETSLVQGNQTVMSQEVMLDKQTHRVVNFGVFCNYNDEDLILFNIGDHSTNLLILKEVLDVFSFVPGADALLEAVKSEKALGEVEEVLNDIGSVKFEFSWAILLVYGPLSREMVSSSSTYMIVKTGPRGYCLVKDGVWHQIRDFQTLLKPNEVTPDRVLHLCYRRIR
jgi:hypothetical protein